MTRSDHELILCSGQGDAAAFTELVRRWEGPVARVVSRLVGRGSESDDLCQDVFLRVLVARKRYRATGAFSTWLYRIALNVARDHARRRQRRPWQSLEFEPASAELPPETGAGRSEVGRAVERAVAALPDELREVVALKHFGRLSFAEIADITGQPASTLKSRMQTALLRLRRELARRGIDQEELEP